MRVVLINFDSSSFSNLSFSGLVFVTHGAMYFTYYFLQIIEKNSNPLFFYLCNKSVNIDVTMN